MANRVRDVIKTVKRDYSKDDIKNEKKRQNSQDVTIIQ